MAINFMMGFENEYENDAIQARSKSGGGGPSPIAVVLDLLGVNRSVAKKPKDLATEEPESVEAPVVNDKGDVVATVQQALTDTSGIQRLPLAPLELGPMADLSGQGLPRSLTRIDPTTGLIR